MADYRDKMDRKELFEKEDYLSPEEGYPERSISNWFLPIILPNVLDNVISNKNILDVGCSFGYCSREFSKHFTNVLGVDLAQNRIDYAKKYETKKLNFLQIDLSKTPLIQYTGSYQFDNVYTSAVIQHIPLEGKPFAIRNIASVTKTGGKLLMFDHREKEEIRDDFVGSYNENYFINNFPEWKFLSVEFIVGDTWFYQFEKV